RKDGRTFLMEINPRLGGGAVASVHAGADIPAMIISEMFGRRPAPVVPKADVLIKRYFEETVFYEA
ncbi:MAG: ATP-grasp domain-containing protein, partial [Paramuribaculum sp.]|nr:ATP-grasp domain-containing protein [Paramuribaculum sp.]